MTERRGLDDFEPGRTGLTVAGLSDGESLEVMGIGNAFLDSTEESEDAIHVPVTVLEAPDGFTDMSGDPIEEAEGEEGDKEYNIINSSTGFYNALVDAVGEQGRTAGQLLTITAHQPGSEATSRYYEISTHGEE